jgi:hypothetical protein
VGRTCFHTNQTKKEKNMTLNRDDEQSIPALMNFRSWVKKTDEITDHDAMLTIKWIVDAALGLTETEQESSE